MLTYDALGRLVKRTKTDFNHDGAVLGEETFVYDAAGNITEDDSGNTYEYGDGNDLWKVNNRRGWTNSNGGNAFYIRPSDTQYKTPMNVNYDAKNRLKTIGGSVNEYWYDAEDNRVNMYHYSTNMKYTYDSAGGRSRLVWSSSHLLEVTTYAYGAEGLIWSRANGKYQVYHYDYRGSVIAVTDIDGNVTDTVAYNAYGKQTERTGTSKLIFGYNGRYGVLSDPNGLLYMRTRYYDPSLKRFMSADVIDGSITDSTSLNVYTFVNGNPISFIDPFGLSADRGGGKEVLQTLTSSEIKAGLKYTKCDGKWYLDYTDVVMNRINEVLPDFIDHMIYSYEDYISKFSTKLFDKWVISVPSWDDYVAHVIGNLWFFYDEVNHSAPWDIKRDGPWKQQFGDKIHMPYYEGGKAESFLFRNEVVTREMLGNITYGYLGSAMGIGDNTLFWGGGVAAKGLSKILSDEVRNNEFYGDSPKDHNSIQKGINYYYEDYPNSKPGINRIFP